MVRRVQYSEQLLNRGDYFFVAGAKRGKWWEMGTAWTKWGQPELRDFSGLL